MIGAWSGRLSECGTRVRVEEGRAASWLCMGLARLAQVVKNLPAMRESWVQSLGWEDPLEKEMATHSSILAWESHGWRSLVVTVHGVPKNGT